MKKLLWLYLAIRPPLLWALLILAIIFDGWLNTAFLCVWLFTLVFSEESYKRYNKYKKEGLVKKEKIEYY